MALKLKLQEFNQITGSQAREVLTHCCGSEQWVSQMLAGRPYSDRELISEKAKKVWHSLDKSDWLEAFQHHPMIGDLKTLRSKYRSTAQLAEKEQQSTAGASEETLQSLAEYNRLYLDKFGFIFIICATGKGADEMLEALKSRMENPRSVEISTAAEEQLKITLLRLKQLIT